MNKLTDLEVCKRIAEIEGCEVFIHPDTRAIYIDNGSYEEMFLYNPLEDKALCWDLMNRYQVSVDFIMPRDVHIHGKNLQKFRNNLERAICLAIIEMHNDN